MADKKKTQTSKSYNDDELNEQVLNDMKKCVSKGYDILLTSAKGGRYKVKKCKIELM